MNNKNIKVTGEWDGEPIWRELSLAERIQKRDDADIHYPMKGDRNVDPNLEYDEESDRELAETLTKYYERIPTRTSHKKTS